MTIEEIRSADTLIKRNMIISFMVTMAREDAQLSIFTIAAMVVGLLSDEQVDRIVDNLNGDDESLNVLIDDAIRIFVNRTRTEETIQ